MHRNVQVIVRAGGKDHPMLKRIIGRIMVRYGGITIRVGYYRISAISTDRIFEMINEIHLADRDFDGAYIKELIISDSIYVSFNVRIPIITRR